jgi:glutathione synthase/RimK-type ligase-like ATP-grasp enzyme
MVQHYVKEVTERGEFSLLFFGGQFSHAAVKKPRSGDFRVQTDFGGSAEPVRPSPSAVTFARRVLEATPERWTYARIDLVETENGPLLMELELIEPHLFFEFDSPAAGRLADCLSLTV